MAEIVFTISFDVKTYITNRRAEIYSCFKKNPNNEKNGSAYQFGICNATLVLAF